MSIKINHQTDSITSTDNSLSIDGVTINPTTPRTGKFSQIYLDALSTSYGWTIKAPSNTINNYTLTLPPSGGTAGQVLQNQGSNTLSWVDLPSGGGGASVASGYYTYYLQQSIGVTSMYGGYGQWNIEFEFNVAGLAATAAPQTTNVYFVNCYPMSPSTWIIEIFDTNNSPLDANIISFVGA